MPAAAKNKRICPKGHSFHKSSDCPTCPICERERAPKAEFMNVLGAPARRALESAGLDSLKKLARKRVDEVLELHGMGPSSIPKLRAALKAAGLAFKS